MRGGDRTYVNANIRPLKDRSSFNVLTIYGLPDHRDGIVRATKAEAEASDEHFDGDTTE